MKPKEFIEKAVPQNKRSQSGTKQSASKSSVLTPKGIIEKMAAKKRISAECAQMLEEILRQEQKQLEALHKKTFDLLCKAVFDDLHASKPTVVRKK